MKNNHRHILYFFFSLIILSGLLLFSFRNQLLDFLRAQENLNASTVPTKITASAAESSDTDILKSPRFTVLTNNVVNFDFDNICYRPNQSAVVSQSAPVDLDKNAATDTVTAAASSTPLNCVRGNSLPFSSK